MTNREDDQPRSFQVLAFKEDGKSADFSDGQPMSFITPHPEMILEVSSLLKWRGQVAIVNVEHLDADMYRTTTYEDLDLVVSESNSPAWSGDVWVELSAIVDGVKQFAVVIDRKAGRTEVEAIDVTGAYTDDLKWLGLRSFLESFPMMVA